MKVKEISLVAVFALALAAVGGAMALERGDMMPEFGLAASDGNYYTVPGILKVSSTAAVFTFFDSKCAPCHKELPLVEKTAVKYGKVKFFMIAVGEDRETVAKCIESWGIKFPVLYDESAELAKACGVVTGSVKNIPKTIVVDSNGVIVKISKGYHPDMADTLSDALQEAFVSKPPVSKTLRILYTNSANAIIKACDCPTNPYGGLVRRLTFFRSILPADLRISAGDYFSANTEPVKNKFIAAIMDRLGYDAVGIGDQEFKTGTDFLINMLKKYALPVVNANMQICDEQTCEMFGMPYVIKKVKGMKIGITGVTGKSCFIFYPKEVREHLKFTQPAVEAVKSLVPQMREKCDFVFVIAHVNERELADIKKIPGIDAIFAGHTQGKYYLPGSPVVVQAGSSGRYVGELVMTVSPEGRAAYSNNFYALTDDIKKDGWGLSQDKEYLIEYRKSLEKLKNREEK